MTIIETTRAALGCAWVGFALGQLAGVVLARLRVWAMPHPSTAHESKETR